MQWDARTRRATQFQQQLFRIPSTKLLTLSTGRTKIVCKECGSAGPRQVFTFFCTVQEYMEHPVPKALETHQTRIHSGATCEIRIGRRRDSCSVLGSLNDDLDGCSSNGSRVNRANESIHRIGTMADDAFMATGDIS